MLKSLLRRLTLWRLRREAVRHLNWLADRLLCDIGTSREDIDHFVKTR